ncbi:MAG: hypothetical protein WBP72_14435, partial [Rhodocyclaceae bacterium]
MTHGRRDKHQGNRNRVMRPAARLTPGPAASPGIAGFQHLLGFFDAQGVHVRQWRHFGRLLETGLERAFEHAGP